MLEVPEGDWAGFDDLTFGLGDATEGLVAGDRSPEKEMEVDVPIQVSVPVSDPQGRGPLPQDETRPLGEGNARAITAMRELESQQA